MTPSPLPDWQDRTVECEVTRNLLPAESPILYRQLWHRWLYEYEPETEAELQLMTSLVNSAWRMRRAEQAMSDTERALHNLSTDACDWPRTQVLNLTRQQRLFAAAESAFHKNLRLVVFMNDRSQKYKKAFDNGVNVWTGNNPALAEIALKDDALARLAARKSVDTPSKPPRNIGGNSGKAQKETGAPVPSSQAAVPGSKKRKKLIRLEQWAEIRTVDGSVVTELYPTNAKLLDRARNMNPAPEVVYRRLHFPEGIPAEYEWVGITNEEHRRRGGMGIQRMTFEIWQELIQEESRAGGQEESRAGGQEESRAGGQEESRAGGGHLLPTGNLPRPEEQGGCDCEICTANRELLESPDDFGGPAQDACEEPDLAA